MATQLLPFVRGRSAPSFHPHPRQNRRQIEPLENRLLLTTGHLEWMRQFGTTSHDGAEAVMVGTDRASGVVMSQIGLMDGTSHDLATRGMTGSGTIDVSLAAGAVVDSAGQPSLASTNSDDIVTSLIPATNLALNQPTVASSDEVAWLAAANATDGKADTRWASGYSDSQWLQVDLGTGYDISRVVLTWETANGKDFEVQVSDDASQWTTIHTVTGNTSLTNDLTGLSGSGRYVRMLGLKRATSWGYSLYEFEIYGNTEPVLSGPTITAPGTATDTDLTTATTTPTMNWNGVSGASRYGLSIRQYPYGATDLVYQNTSLTGTSFTLPAGALQSGVEYQWSMTSFNSAGVEGEAGNALYFQTPTLPSGTNLALNRPVVASSVEVSWTEAINLTDGMANTRWSSSYSDPQWIYVDLGQSHSIHRVVLTWEAAYGEDYQIQVSNDAANWTIIKSVSGNTSLTNDLTGLSGSGRYVRMLGLKRGTIYGYSLWELEVYGTSTAAHPLGTNLAGLSPLSTQWDFTDLMKNASDWYVPNRSPLTLDANGWPTAIPEGETYLGTQVRLRLDWIRSRIPSYPAGDYLVSWEGTGEFELWGDATNSYTVATGSGSRYINISPSSPGEYFGLYLRMLQIDPADPLRNIRITMPGYGAGEVRSGQEFNQLFVDRLQPFGTLRFMSWMAASENLTSSWDQRPKTTDRNYVTTKGVPVESMVALSNQSQANPWFNMPVAADDDYVRQFATYVKLNLDPDLKVYVEWGNEPWSPAQPAGQNYIKSLIPADQNPNVYWPQYWAQEAKRDFRIWREVFAGEEDRIVRVAAGQTYNRWATPRFLEALGGEFDAIGAGAYIAAPIRNYDASTTVDQIVADLLADMRYSADPTLRTDTEATSNPHWDGYLLGTNQSVGVWPYHRQLADYFSNQLGREIDLIAYEGGQFIMPQDQSVPWYDAYMAAQRDPRMGELYTELLRTWYEDIGGSLFVNFTSVSPINEWGAWGVLEYQDQPLEEAPKYTALMDFAAVPEPAPPEPSSAPLLP